MDAIKSKPSNLNTFIQDFPFGIVIQNTSGEVISANAEAQKILNLSLDQLRGKKSVDPHWKAIREDGSPFPKEELPGMISLKTGKKVKGVIMGVLHPELSSCKWLEVNAVPQFIQDTKNICQVYSVLRDITEKIKTEQSLKDSERTLSSFMDNLLGMAYRCKIDHNWTMLFVSKGCLELTGYSPDDIIGNNKITFANIIHPDDREKVFQDIATAIEEKRRFKIKYRIITANDQIKYVIERGKAHYENNIPLFLEGLIEDNTNQIIAEEDLHEKELAISSAIYAVAISDLSGKITYVNPAFLAMWGYTSTEEVIGKQSVQFWKSPERANNIINMLFEKGTWQGELVAVKKDGTDFHTLLSANLIYDKEGNPKKMMASFIDISERKKNQNELILAKEKAEESSQLKSAFLATISHEFRTPLNAIIGFSDIICEIEKGSKTGEFAKIVVNSGLNLLEIIEDIFSLSLLNNEKIKLRLNAFVVNTLYNNLKKQLKEILFQSGKKHSIELLFNSDQDFLEKNIIADIGKINQVMFNLMKNAIKFTDEGTVELGISLKGKNKITLFVKDTGIGITSEQQKYIFDLFRQGDDSHTRIYGGLGIGLAISKRLADAMNGDLFCTSSPGKGSLFSFTFPFETDPKCFNQYAVNYSEIAPSLTNSTILIVEDDPASMLLTRNHLVFTGAKILKAENGKEAIRLVESNSKIDLVLMDIKMPVLNGYEATKAIKSFNNQILVIALTSYSFEDEKQKIIDAGCDDIITKPVNKKQLYTLLQLYLKN